MKKVALFLCLSIAFVTASFAEQVLTVDEVLAKLQAQQNSIMDFSADFTTLAQTQNDKESINIVGKIWSKQPSMDKVCFDSPFPGTTIKNGNKQVLINSSGEKFDVPPKSGAENQLKANEFGGLKYDHFKDYYVMRILSIKKDGTINLSCVAKTSDSLCGKPDYMIDTNLSVVKEIIEYDKTGKFLMKTSNSFSKINGVLASVKCVIKYSDPNPTIIETKYSNIKINQGISDEEFAIE